MRIRVLALLVFISISGCSTPGSYTFESGNRSLAYIQRTVDHAMPRGLRKVSPNGREFFSNYFLPQGSDLIDGAEKSRRFFAHVTILGDRRPYQIEVLVRLEKRSKPGEYQFVKNDQRIAKALFKRIQRRLVKGRDNQNIVDDFRVF